jgi:hypothetical protein
MTRLGRQGQAHANTSQRKYTDRCTVRTIVTVKGTHGGQVPGIGQVLVSDHPCRVLPSSADEKQLAGATQSGTAFTVRMPAWSNGDAVQVQARGEIEIAARDGIAARTLKIVAPLPNQGLWIEVVGTEGS